MIKKSPRMIWLVAAIALALTTLIATPAAAQPTATSQLRIINWNSGLCLTIAGGSSVPNTRAVQYNCDWHPSRFWRLVTGGNAGNDYHIVNANSGLCLTIAGGSDQLNAVAVQYSCDRFVSRRWQVITTAQGLTLFRNAYSGWCLTIAGGSTALNADAVQYRCDGHPSRYWMNVNVPGER